MSNPSVTVIGAGIVGVCCALHLQRLGYRVTVVDQRPPGDATSYGNACMITDSSLVPLATPGITWEGLGMLLNPSGPLFIRPRYALQVMPWLWRFWRSADDAQARAGAQALGNLLRGALAEHHELADHTSASRWLGDDPSLFVYRSAAELEHDAYTWTLRQANGVRHEWLEGSQLREREPALAADYWRAAVLLDHGRAVDPAELTKAHAEWLQRRGGTIRQARVQALEVSDGQVVRLLTDDEPLAVEQLVIAGGAWSAQLALQLGDQIPLESEGGYHLTLTDPGIELRHTLMDSAAKVAIAPMAAGIRIGGMVEFAGIREDTLPQRSALLRTVIQRILPAIRTEAYTEWRGNRPCLPDSLPVIDRASQVNNVVYAFGHQHIGLSAAPKTGKLVAQLIAGQPPAIDLNPFRVGRF